MPVASLMNKRLTGAINWHRGRSEIHNMAVLDALITDLVAQKPDHIALTGDLVNVGFPAEFPQAAARLEPLGGPAEVSLIPGNHDVYVRGSLAAMRATFDPFLTGDDGKAGRFPYLRRRGGIALIGVNSGIVTAPFFATGRVGAEQRRALSALLRQTEQEGLFRVVMIHHPPYPEGARFGRGLRDARAVDALLRDAAPELVLHGHNHRFSLVDRPTGGGRHVPVLGIGSASAVPGTPRHRAEYALIRIEDDGALTVERRAADASGAFSVMERHSRPGKADFSLNAPAKKT